MSFVHHRKPDSFMGLCGAGYAYPSTISFSKKDNPATCPECIRLWDHDISAIAEELKEFLDVVDEITVHITPEYVQNRLNEMLKGIQES